MRSRSLVQLLLLALLVGLVVGAPSAQGAGEPGVVRVAAAGDFGASANTRAVLAGMAARQPDLALALGDLSYGATGQEQAWCDLVTSELGAGFPFELLAGNHESNGQNGHINDFAACLPNQLPGVIGTYGRQYHVDVPQVDPLVRFVMISPALQFPDGTWTYPAGSARYNWTAAAIDGARAEGVPWVVVGVHKPCLSLGIYSCEIGGDLMQLLMDRRVDLVLHGHEHLYQRTHQLGTRTGCAVLTPGTFDADCIADGDSTMTQGAGTVFATSGAAGQELRTVNAADSEAGWFAASSGSNRNPSYGFLDLEITADELAGRFVPVGGGTFTDAFTIARGDTPPPPPNTPPTSAFTATGSGLTVALDGRGSTDTDGTVTGHTWDLGDGTAPATGAQVQHSYAAAGSYPVTLTVTDDDGATASTTQTVTVTAPPTSGAFVSDTFARTVAGGLGTADVGGAWTTSGTAGSFSVGNGSGVLALTRAGTTLSCWLGATTRTDADLRMTLALDRVPTGSGAYIDVVGRRVSTNNEYRARLVLAANGRVTVALTALRGTSTAATIASGVQLPATVSYAAGTPLNVRLQVTGTNPTQLRLKVWRADQPEPAAWQLQATDSGAGLQTAGAVGVTAYLSGSVTNAPVTLRLSQLSARPVG